MLRFGDNNLIQPETTSESSNPSEIDQKYVLNMTHKKGLVSMFTVAKVFKILKIYSD